jgi:hypothetical protein
MLYGIFSLIFALRKYQRLTLSLDAIKMTNVLGQGLWVVHFDEISRFGFIDGTELYPLPSEDSQEISTLAVSTKILVIVTKENEFIEINQTDFSEIIEVYKFIKDCANTKRIYI